MRGKTAGNRAQRPGDDRRRSSSGSVERDRHLPDYATYMDTKPCKDASLRREERVARPTTDPADLPTCYYIKYFQRHNRPHCQVHWRICQSGLPEQYLGTRAGLHPVRNERKKNGCWAIPAIWPVSHLSIAHRRGVIHNVQCNRNCAATTGGSSRNGDIALANNPHCLELPTAEAVRTRGKFPDGCLLRIPSVVFLFLGIRGGK